MYYVSCCNQKISKHPVEICYIFPNRQWLMRNLKYVKI